jgi:DNA transposition AAA+ family ATPase
MTRPPAAPTRNGADAPTLALLKNVSACMALVDELRSRGPHLPGIGVLHGPSGFGKSYSTIFVQNKTRALRVEVGKSWTMRTLVQRILAEAGVEARGTIADMTEQTIRFLGDDPSRPLIVDEADQLVDRGMIEIVREIHEHSQAPVLLVGEELLPAKLQRSERTHNRVLNWVAAQPCDAADTRQLIKLFCPTLTIADDLAEAIRARSAGRARRIVVNANRIAEFARNKGVGKLDLAAYDGPFFTGEPPTRARAA